MLDEFVALYAFHGQEDGDLSFDVGETVIVKAKDGDWWTGTTNGRTGIFPANYVTRKQVEVRTCSNNDKSCLKLNFSFHNT